MTPGGGGPAAGSAGAPPVAAVIDVGSNSVLLLVVAVGQDGGLRAVDQALATTRLGAGLAPGGPLEPAARARTGEAVMAFAARARAAGARHVWAFATGAVRDAADGADFAATVGVEAGVQLEVIDGTREAHLAYAAVAVLAYGGPLLAVDVGGRTTELSLGNGAGAPATVSLPLGALSLTEAHMRRDPPAPAELAAAAAAIAALLATTDLPARAGAARAVVVASGGTATALAALDLGLITYSPRRVHGHVLSRPALRQHRERLAAMPLAARAALPALDAGRAAILPAGVLVLEHVAAAAGAAGIHVSDLGVRHAYLAERLAGFGVVPDLRGLWG